MDITAEQFAEVLKSLGEPRGNEPSDKRRAPRVTHRCRASITLGAEPDAGPRVSVTVKDFSPRGICIVRSTELPNGTQFVIAMTRKGSLPVHILCTVVHCRPVSKEMFTIGAEFTCILNNAPAKAVPRGTPKDLDRIRQSVLD